MYEDDIDTFEDRGVNSFSNWASTRLLFFTEDGEIEIGRTVAVSAVVYGLIGGVLSLLVNDAVSGEIRDENAGFAYVTGSTITYLVLGALTGWLWTKEIDIADTIYPRRILGPYLFPLGALLGVGVIVAASDQSKIHGAILFERGTWSAFGCGFIFLLVAYLFDRVKKNSHTIKTINEGLMSLSNEHEYQREQILVDDSVIHGSDEALNLIEKLGSLRDKGLLTQQEFEEKKQKLLNEI